MKVFSLPGGKHSGVTTVGQMRARRRTRGYLSVLTVCAGLFAAQGALAAPGDHFTRLSGDWNSPSVWGRELTGSVQFFNNATNVLGTGTLFTTEVAPGDQLVMVNTIGIIRGTVASIVDDTHLILTASSVGSAGGAFGKLVAASPTVADSGLLVSHDINITADLIVDELFVDSGASLTVTNGVTLTVADGPGTDFQEFNADVIIHGALVVEAGAVASGGGGNGNTTGYLFVEPTGTITLDGTIDGGGQSVSWGLTVQAGGVVDVSGTGVLSMNRGNGGVLITIGGLVTVADGGTIEVNGAGSGLVQSGGTLELAPTTFFSAHTFTIVAGGTLKIGSPAGITASGSTGAIRSTFRIFGTGANYVYNGTALQSTGNGLPAGLNGTLTIDNASGVNLLRDTTISNALVLTSGRLITAATNKVIVAEGGTVSGASAASYVQGNLQKRFVTGGGQAFTYDVGDSAIYAPVAFENLDVATAGNLLVTTTGIDHPSIGTSGIKPAKDVNRYWTFTASGGLAPNTYDATFNFAPSDVDAGATPIGFIVERFTGGAWTNTTTGTRTATSTQATGLNGFSDFAVGESLTAFPFVSIDDQSVAEGDAGTVTATFTVSMVPASTNTVTFDYATSNGTAEAGVDYTGVSGSITFDPGMTSTTITVDVSGDVLDEADETFTVELSNAVLGDIVDGSGLGTITDDDATPDLSIDDATVTEGDAGSVAATFTLTLSTASGRDVSVDVATSNGTAEAGLDFTALATTVTLPAGATSTTLTVDVTGDLLDEVDETYTLELSNPVDVGVTDAMGQGTITDDDAAPDLFIDDVTVTEGDLGNAAAIFTVSLSAASGQDVTVDFASSNGTAEAGLDYAAAAGTLTLPAGMTSTTLTVDVSGDTLDENDEAYTVELSNAANAGISDGSGAGTITDDDDAPELSIDDAAVTEGDAGFVQATFTVSLTAASSFTINVDYTTTNGTAELGPDYAATIGTLTFEPGMTSTTLTVDVTGDTLDEADETYMVELSNPSNASISDGSGLGTITDDDATPDLSIDDAIVTEGDAGTTQASFTVTLSAASSFAVTADYTTSNGTAEAGLDYTAATGSLTIEPGMTSTTVTVDVSGDTLDENDETFTLELSNAANASLTDGVGEGTITDDDAVEIAIDDVSVPEGDAGSVAAEFTVTLSVASSFEVTVDYATSNGTAEAGSDFDSATGTLTFAPGVTSTTLTVNVQGDLANEGDETYTVEFSNPVNATATDVGVGTIEDNDGPPELSIDDVTVTEGDAGTVEAIFTVTLSQLSGVDVTVDVATSNGTAEAGLDYTAVLETLTIPAGQTSTTLTVNVISDTLDENDEVYTVELTNPSNATIDDGSGLGTVTDDDAAPDLSISDVTVTEGDVGTVQATFTVSLSTASGFDVTADFASSNGTAEAGLDYAAAAGTVTLPAGMTSTTLTVDVTGDVLDEVDESYTVELSNAVNASITDGSGLGTITDDDDAPEVLIDDVSVPEGDAGSVEAVFTVSLSAPSSFEVTVDYVTSNGTAEAGSDYDAAMATLTFAPGMTSTTLTVAVTGDTLDEAADETYTVELSNPANASIGDGSGLGTIEDDDQPEISIDDVTVTEGDAGTVDAIFTISLSNPSVATLTVDFATSNGTAEAGSDFDAASGTLTFAPGMTSTTLAVVVNGDLLFEVSDETYTVELTNPSGATIADGSGAGTITEDDAQPEISIDDATVTEGNGGATDAVFTVTLSGASVQSITATFDLDDDTAVVDEDYSDATGTVTFEPGVTSTTLTASVLGDLLDEDDETFLVTLSVPVNATLADADATGTITDDDDPPAVTIDDVSVLEGDDGDLPIMTFTVSLSAPSSLEITVDYETTEGTEGNFAVDGEDYTGVLDTLTFEPGETNLTIEVEVTGDTANEPTETFTVDLSGEVNATLADAQGVGTIINDDGQHRLRISDATVLEGDDGTVTATYTVSLSNLTSQIVTVDYATSNITAIAGDDYAATNGTLTFDPGVTNLTLTVDIIGDQLDEADETYAVRLSNPDNATILDGVGAGTITDDDTSPTAFCQSVTVQLDAFGSASITAAQVDNGSTGEFEIVSLTISQYDFACADVGTNTVTLTATDSFGNEGTCQASVIVQDVTPPTLTLPADAEVSCEASTDPSETGTATATDVCDLGVPPPAPRIWINEFHYDNPGADTNEFVEIAGTADFDLSTSKLLLYNGANGFPYVTNNLSSFSVTNEGCGYGAFRVNTVGLQNGSPDGIVLMVGTQVIEFLSYEGTLTATGGPAIGTASVDIGVFEPGSTEPPATSLQKVGAGDTAAAFTWTNLVAMSGGLLNAGQTITPCFVGGGTSVTVDYADGAPSGSCPITFPRTWTATDLYGNATQGVQVISLVDTNPPVVTCPADIEVECGDDTSTNATGVATAIDACSAVISLTFVDDVDEPGCGMTITRTWSAVDTCGNTGTCDQVITVVDTTLPEAVCQDIVVQLDAFGAATITGDDVDDGSSDSCSTVSLSVDPSSFTESELGDNTVTLTVTDACSNEDTCEATVTVEPYVAPEISIDDATVTEGDGGVQEASFTISLSAATQVDIDVDVTTSNGTAEAGADYSAVADTVTIVAGMTSTTLTVEVIGDTLDEADETYTVELSNPVNGTLADGTGLGTITDDDVGDLGIFAMGIAPITIEWLGSVGQTYTVEYTTNLLPVVDWDPLAGYEDIPGINGVMTAIDSNVTEVVKFYRVQAVSGD